MHAMCFHASAIRIHIVHRTCTCRACNDNEISEAQRKNKIHDDQSSKEVSLRMKSIDHKTLV